MSISLSLQSLPALAPRASVPSYARADLKPGIFHFGVGNFHRAHQAVYLDDLFNLGLNRDWAIVGGGTRPGDEAMRKGLASQDFLTTVVEREADRSDARIIASMVDFVPVGDAAAVLARLGDPSIRIVSLTITEGGYYIDPATQRFDQGHPDIVRDAANLNAPGTVFGFIVAALKARREAGIPPFTIMSCDNLPGNGHVTANAVAGLADLVDPALARWVREVVAFPSSMVDRITPVTGMAERDWLESNCGIADAHPVFCESYRQWIVEDRFPNGRPAFEKVGVRFVGDVAPFELMKIRILNGAHAALAYPAALLDIHNVHDAVDDPLIGTFLSRLLDEEVIPVVPPVPGTDLREYKALVLRRFSNPKIADTTARLCFDGSNRQPKFILPSLRDRLRRGASMEGLALVGAFWCRYCAGETESGAAIPPNDPQWARLQKQALLARANPKAWLSMTDIFAELGTSDAYVSAFSTALTRVWEQGSGAALRHYVEAA